ncbi:MAG TPA: cyclic nucleotide-gated ion channel [Rhizomicrobium sp.]|nr:cyclic nucleotide-gated ion channel [Rhizomicrobium sp.]
MTKASGETLRRRVYIVLEGGRAAGWLGTVVEAGLIVLIVANVVAFSLQSMPFITRDRETALGVFEIVSVAIFGLEYLTRLWVSVEDPLVAMQGEAKGRFWYATRPMMLIDFFAIAPAFIQFFVPFFDLRVLRLVRVFRLLKIARYSPALNTLGKVIMEERHALFGTLLLLLCAMVFAAAAMHAVEGQAQPAKFGTIPEAMWWAIATLTTVGYGDAVPITPLGRVIAGITMIVGLGLFALPVGIVATGFVSTIHKRDFVVTFGMLARVPLFRDFDAHVIGEILDHLRAHSVGPGAILSAQGERAEAMYFIVSGSVDVKLPRRSLRFGSGDFFGELALLTETMRAANVVSTTSARYLALSTLDFETLMRHHPELKERVLRNAASQVEDIAVAGGISETEIAAAQKARAEAV